MNPRRCFMRLFPAVFMLALLMPVAQAQVPSVEQLQRKLQLRDRVIDELLTRVEALERRAGVRRSTRNAAETSDKTVRADRPGKPGKKAAPKSLADRFGAAPGTIVVEEGADERALERSLTRAGGLLLPPGILEVEPSFTYARQEDTAPSFVTVSGVTFLGQTESNSVRQTADLALRLGLPWDSQLELGLPFRRRDVETVSNVGFTPTGSSSVSGMGHGDLRVGLAKTLLREGLWRPDLVGRITWDTDIGRTTDNGVSLGGGFHELRGSLTAIKRQDPIAFIGGLSYQHSFEKGNLQAGSVIGANFGGYMALSPETSVRLVLSGGYQNETEVSGVDFSGSSQTLGSLVVGGSTLLAPGTLLNLSLGIGLTDDSDDFSISMSIPIRMGQPLF
jgi:hypothetical protein